MARKCRPHMFIEIVWRTIKELSYEISQSATSEYFPLLLQVLEVLVEFLSKPVSPCWARQRDSAQRTPVQPGSAGGADEVGVLAHVERGRGNFQAGRTLQFSLLVCNRSLQESEHLVFLDFLGLDYLLT